MSTTFCPTLSGDPAIAFVNGGYSTFMSLAPRAFNEAQRYAEQLTRIDINPIEFDVSFNLTHQLTPFQRPERPTLDATAFDFRIDTTLPAAPTFSSNTPAVTPVPEADLTAPTLFFGDRPSTPSVAEPIAPPRPAALVIPDAPDYVLPPLPTFEQLNLPTVPNITLPEFEGTRPDFIEPNIDGNWRFDPVAYASSLKDKLTAKIEAWMEGQPALPDAIENAIFVRGRARIEVESRRAIDTRIDEFATRGFTEPQGALLGSINDLLKTAVDQKGSLNRDITIKMAEEALQNMRLAVQQGIALEQVAVNLHIQEQGLILQGMQFQRETSIAILNAKISVFNARLQAYQTDAQVLRDKIQAELSAVELYKAQIEGERAKGEINEQRTRIYVERVRALDVLANLYRSRVEGVKTQADVQRAQIEAFRSEVEAYSARWEAFAREYDGYKASIEAENTKATVHRNLVDAYANRIQAWSTQNNLNFDRERLRLAEFQGNLQGWQGQLERMRTLVGAETARIQSVGTLVDARARMYTADAGVEQAASAASDRTMEIALRKESARTDVELKKADMRIQENIQLTQLLLEVRKTLSQVSSQLAASAMSAMNFSAGVSSSRSEGKSCNTSYNFSGEIVDAT